MWVKIFTTILLVALSSLVFSQPRSLSTKNRKAIESYKAALEAYNKYDTKNAERLLAMAIKFDKKFIESYLTLSQLLQEQGRNEEAIAAADKAIAINPDFFPSIYYNIGNMLFRSGRYHEALERYKKYLSYRNLRAELAYMARFKSSCCNFAIEATKNPVPFEPRSLGASINTTLDEYWPSLSADESTLVFTANIPIDTVSSSAFTRRQEDFFISNRDQSGQWATAQAIGPPINTVRNNEGAQSLTADGKRMYYTVCAGVCNIYYSNRLQNGEWSKPIKLPEPLNLPTTSEKQPSISPDGRTLYFVSNREGSKGRFDIWYSHLISDWEWTTPANISDSINTPFNEQSPFIHFDNQTLFFASDGHIGMGGLDLFFSKRINDTLWSKPMNLGYPINTYADEDGLIVNATGNTAYYSSDRVPNMGRDIFTFELYPEARPHPVSYITGTIRDSKTDGPLKAQFNLTDIDTGLKIMSSTSGDDGSYIVCLPANRSYAFMASAPKYLFYSEHINLKDVHSASQPLNLNIFLKPISVGEVMVMRNVFFETASWDLKEESLVELENLFELLTINPQIRIEIGGHTDSVGGEKDNLLLSNNRAKSVADFLLSKGIDQKRLTWHGYGEANPMADNDTPEGRAQNRRTEVKVMSLN
jgi:outer membrane protein OmpA-like peptidoglycan-associated protein/tetratricopeptide (TPR) repeat protein